MISMHAGSDYLPPVRMYNDGPDQFGNLRWRAGNTFPNRPFMVRIVNDDIPEPVEVMEVIVQCIATENCYLPRSVYTITIIDDEGECEFKVPGGYYHSNTFLCSGLHSFESHLWFCGSNDSCDGVENVNVRK